MPKDFREEEERLRFLVVKIDAEITRFSELKEKLELRQEDLSNALRSEGLQPVPIIFQPSSGTKDLLDELTDHVLELNKMKNFVAQKLNMVIKEEELLEKLRKKHGSAVDLKHLPSGEFELVINDTDTQQVFTQVQASRKNMNSLKKTIQELTEE